MKMNFFKSQRDFIDTIRSNRVNTEIFTELLLSEGYKKHGGDLYLVEYTEYNYILNIFRGTITDNQFIHENDDDCIYDLPCENVVLFQMNK